ncbi:uncharacterized protein LACBIDRAFT_333870 [Laccaria bicolor S238N-H82]|uniref:Predicted protein n=1 Tax=Laccaria bicolor (strain S238N-H82 / ATCC MYA-4686) TaxID=486041 RepID=B0DXC5_LACBS|nr:uncharacterized protein LACBIDRAFT_333870 [Laccaria bicolor S238N-H82]EDR00767.1 predicted protein [Laccaria bicolor S238N-H82]|eukprot:XP_001888559.1 predicted protein [Laccaria bicolor S238N-H82]
MADSEDFWHPFFKIRIDNQKNRGSRNELTANDLVLSLYMIVLLAGDGKLQEIEWEQWNNATVNTQKVVRTHGAFAFGHREPTKGGVIFLSKAATSSSLLIRCSSGKFPFALQPASGDLLVPAKST